VSTAGVGLTALVMALGLLGTVLPALPGLALIWAAGLVYGLVDGFGGAGWAAFVAMTLLLAAGSAAKFVLPHRSGVAQGMPGATLALAAVLGVVGFFVIPVVGLVVGAVLGVVLGEYRRLGGLPPALVATRRILVAYGVGVLVEIAAGMAMIACWAAWAVLGR
jgi:uncharacterized protein YqgC (DUF456 family)